MSTLNNIPNILFYDSLPISLSLSITFNSNCLNQINSVFGKSQDFKTWKDNHLWNLLNFIKTFKHGCVNLT